MWMKGREEGRADRTSHNSWDVGNAWKAGSQDAAHMSGVVDEVEEKWDLVTRRGNPGCRASQGKGTGSSGGTLLQKCRWDTRGRPATGSWLRGPAAQRGGPVWGGLACGRQLKAWGRPDHLENARRWRGKGGQRLPRNSTEQQARKVFSGKQPEKKHEEKRSWQGSLPGVNEHFFEPTCCVYCHHSVSGSYTISAWTGRGTQKKRVGRRVVTGYPWGPGEGGRGARWESWLSRCWKSQPTSHIQTSECVLFDISTPDFHSNIGQSGTQLIITKKTGQYAQSYAFQ